MSEPIQLVEIDVDTCSLTWGTWPCGARFGNTELRTNLALRSQEFDNATWSKTSAQGTVTANASTAPDGTTTADSYIENSATNFRFILQNINFTSGLTYVYSCFVKRASGTRNFQLILSAAAFGSFAIATFNLDAITATVTAGETASIQSVGSGWYRCQIVATATATASAQAQIRIVPDTHTAATANSYTGDGTSGVYLWGAQVEVGSNLSDYIPTTTAAVSLASTGTVRKCYNTYATCTSKTNYTKTTLTQKFCNNRASLPKGLKAYPAMVENGITAFSSTVNIAGANEQLGAFGRRATASVKLLDFPTNDIWFDNYQSERVSGTAQTDESGYNPYTRGTYFGKLKKRWPYYAGRPMRFIDGYIENGTLADTRTRYYIITNIVGPGADGSVTIEGKDVLALADDKKALYPRPSKGKIDADLTDADGESFDLTPAGIGAEYPASGYATIGSEVVAFTRSTDTITLTERGLGGTIATTHSIDDTFQEAKRLEDVRVDDFLYDLLVNYASIDVAFIPVADWGDEVTTWLSSIRLNTFITKPTGVTQLVNELGVLGLSIWWDDVAQEIKLLANRPFFNDTLYDITDDSHIKAIEQEDLDEDRLTQVHIYSVQTDVTKDVRDKSNYDRIQVIIDTEAEGTNAYNDTRVREIFCRYLNTGADNILRIIGTRLLKRFNNSPTEYVITLDAKDRDVELGAVLNISSYIIQDDTGNPQSRLAQVFRKVEKRSGHDIEISAQAYRYTGQYGRVAPTGTVNFSSATDSEKNLYTFIVGASGLNSDGTNPNTII